MGRPVKGWQLHEIYITAKTTSGGTAQKVVGGASTSDDIYESYTWSNGIIKQETSRGYYVQTPDGQARCRLVAGTPGYKQATIIATDSTGNTYYVTKLTAHLALLTQKTKAADPAVWEFATGKDVEWTFASPELGKTVQIENND
ncbi:hypothetical protein UFOVP181_350 [uncultured Caudovirales phage]|uniref:Uncharacterized protein n=1 Tax=uncultured Caudovirales phage TaxID=2100421 RepID=A0A6J7WHK1_9CAUD|nr:hypothetical protein UFOVP57_289 [uncultured Caudovirales phage]CAB5209187.1 hypothetical protein UFOVP181_350 [uncultured Caudovirales phage]